MEGSPRRLAGASDPAGFTPCCWLGCKSVGVSRSFPTLSYSAGRSPQHPKPGEYLPGGSRCLISGERRECPHFTDGKPKP